ncbi:J domain-containing protein [Aspergillus undulatus]|uniref:J domain-containing protein n=1 Tax=Aspergillus undulatus TaxID=1810928 RepID=UPI003CCCD14B
MTALPDFDAYEALGVTKDATTAEIKSSHRKLVLKCHPDKIKDEALREQAQDQFQKVQQAYECLSDETTRAKYDNKVKLAELKREMAARGASYTRSHPREYRDGRIYEERVPTDPEAFFEDEERFAESPRPTSRKHEEYGTRPRSRAMDEKRRSKAASSSSASAARAYAKEVRESAKATRADRDKYRTKERRRETYDKHYVESDSSASEAEVYYIPVKQPSKSKKYSKTKPTESSSRRSRTHHRDEDDDYYSDDREPSYKHDMQYTSARDYIRRSKETIADPDRRRRSSRSPFGYDAAELETSRRSGRSTRSSRPPTSHHSSFEDLEPPLPRSHDKVPSMPTSQTFPGPTSSPKPSRSAWVRSPSRSNRESSRRSGSVHVNGKVYAEPRTSKLRGEKSDSGYASSSPTPDIPEASPKPSRYKDSRPNPVIVEPRAEPPPLRHSRTYSPPRPERRMPPRSSTTYTYPSEPISREPTSRRFFREVDSDQLHKERERHSRGSDEPKVQYIRPPYPSHTHSDYARHSSRRTHPFTSLASTTA